MEPEGGNIYKDHPLMVKPGKFWRCAHGNTGWRNGQWIGCEQCKNEINFDEFDIGEDFCFNNTLKVVKELYNGKILELPDGNRIGMAEDFTIGFVFTNSNGEEGISTFSDTLDLCDLNKLLRKHGLIILGG